MASFTDTQTPRFNPYIQQLPVEAMATVGMQKQKAYEEGVQKIQTQIDNIAGLDVVRDVDKAYLQSKLNELGNKLKTVAGGDFSNFQLVNSVGGMTKQLISDEGIKNAVSSTAKLRKEQAFMEEERKKGELNPANAYIFNRDVSSWINSNDITDSFDTKYEKYFDVNKFVKESFAALQKDGINIDQIFKTDGNGNPIINPKTKSYELSTTMSKLKKEGLFPEKVQQTLSHIFNDPRVSRQLQIEGQYNYRNTSIEDLTGRLIQTKDSQVEILDNALAEKNAKKAMLKDGPERVKLQAEIDDLLDTKTKTVDNYNNLITNISDNADAVRGMLYKEEEKGKYKEMYTNVIEERTVHANPAWDANFKMQQEANEQTRHAQKMQIDMIKIGQDERKMAQDERIALMKMNNDYNIAALKGEKDIETAAANYTTGDISSPMGLIDADKKEGENVWNTYTKATDDLLLNTNIISQDYLKKVKATHPGISETEAMKYAVNQMAKAAGKTPSQFRTEKLMQAESWLNEKPSRLTPEMTARKLSVENSKENLQQYRDRKALIDKEAPTKGLSIYKNTKDMKNPYAPNGVLTREDQLDLAIFHNGTGFFATEESKNSAKAAQERLAKRGYTKDKVATILKDINKAAPYSGVAEKIVGLFSDDDAVTNDPFLNFRRLMDAANSNEFNTSIEKRAAAIQKYSNFAPSVSKQLDTGKTEVDRGYRQNIKTYIGRYARAGQNESPGFIGNVDKMTAIAADDKNGSIEMRAEKSKLTGEIVHKAVFYNEKGEYVGDMTVSPDEAASVNFHPEIKYSTPEMRYVENKMAVTQNGSTSYGDVRNMDTYRYNDVGLTKSKFPKLAGTSADVKANIKAVEVVNADGTSQTMYYNYMYVNDGEIKFIKPLGTPKSSVEEAIQALQQIDVPQLNTLIAEQKRQK